MNKLGLTSNPRVAFKQLVTCNYALVRVAKRKGLEVIFKFLTSEGPKRGGSYCRLSDRYHATWAFI